MRDQYMAHVTKMLSFGGAPPQAALRDAKGGAGVETALAKASQSVTERRNPESIYHLEATSEFEKSLPLVRFGSFLDAVHSPRVAELNVTNPSYFPAMLQAIRGRTLRRCTLICATTF